MLGFSSFLPSTTFFGPHFIFLSLIVVGIRLFSGFSQNKIKLPQLSNKQIVGLFLIFVSGFFAVLLFIFVGPLIDNYDKSILGAFPYIVMLVLAIFISLFFNEKDFYALLYLILFEILVGGMEYIAGVRSFFSVNILGQTQFGDTELLYYNRVYGLSDTSSMFAFKVLIGFVLLYYFKDAFLNHIKRIFFALLVLGLFLSFSRTVLFSLFAWVVFLNFKSMKFWLILLLLVVIASPWFYFFENQLMRGQVGLDYSGRDFIFVGFYDFIAAHPVFGNSGSKLWFDIGGALYHAHNSYLELIASNGFFISLFFLAGIALLLKGNAIRVCFPIFVYSSFQYGIFWGLSFNDVIFFALIFAAGKVSYHKNVELRNKYGAGND